MFLCSQFFGGHSFIKMRWIRVLIFALHRFNFHLKFTLSWLINLERHFSIVETLDLSYRWEPTFESQLTLKEAVLLSLGTIRVHYTLDEFYLVFEIFSAIKPQYLHYSGISNKQLWKYLEKLEKEGYISISISAKKEITLALTEEGAKEADSLIANISSELVEDRMDSLREYFGISIPAI